MVSQDQKLLNSGGFPPTGPDDSSSPFGLKARSERNVSFLLLADRTFGKPPIFIPARPESGDRAVLDMEKPSRQVDRRQDNDPPAGNAGE